MTEEKKGKARALFESLMNSLAEGLIKRVRLFIRIITVMMGLFIVAFAMDGSMNSQSIDPEYIGIMMTSSTFLFGMFFTQTKAEPNQTITFKVSHMIAWFFYFVTIFFLLMSVLSEVTGNMPVFLNATLSVLINLELYFSYYYFE